MNKVDALFKLIEQSDMDFKIKIFPKLPPISELHLEVFSSILKGKNWRSKVNVIQNIEKRLLNNDERA